MLKHGVLVNIDNRIKQIFAIYKGKLLETDIIEERDKCIIAEMRRLDI